MTTTSLWDTAAVGKRKWPTTWSARHDEQRRRRSVVLMERYGDDDVKRLCLFRGTRADGTIIHEAQRISPLIRFVASVNTMTLARPWTLNLRDDAVPEPTEDDARLTRGMETWRRSRVDERSRWWADNLSVEGDAYIEAAVDAQGRPVVVHHKPDRVSYWIDDTVGLDIVRVVIEFEAPHPTDASAGPVKHVRTLTPDTISHTIDGQHIQGSPKAHRLGVVPFVAVQYAPSGVDPFLGCPPWWGIEDGVAVHDSATTILSVMGTKRANPALFAEGVDPTVPDDQAGAAVANGVAGGSVEGSVIVGPEGSDIRPIASGLEGAQVIHERAEGVHAIVATTCPELLFTEAGASASGTALSHRASLFVAKAGPVDRGLRGGVGRALALAHALADNAVWSDALDVYDVTAGPLLPLDVAAAVDAHMRARESGLVLDVDTVRAWQDYGIVPRDADPEAYADSAREQDGARTRTTAEAMGLRAERAAAAREETPDDEPDDSLDDEAPA